MENVKWVTMYVLDLEVTVVYGSYEHVPISYGVVTLFKANSYYRL